MTVEAIFDWARASVGTMVNAKPSAALNTVSRRNAHGVGRAEFAIMSPSFTDGPRSGRATPRIHKIHWHVSRPNKAASPTAIAVTVAKCRFQMSIEVSY